jgi:exonuclease SbcC
MLEIEKITLEGFRGINKPLDFALDSKRPIVMLRGQNGLGKTSVLQAIEWCLTGQLLNFTGGDFAREDALVSLFHKNKKASVEITLVDDDGSKIKVHRSKKMGKTTGRGGSALQVEVAGKTLHDDDADAAIVKTIFDAVEDPATLFHLHQDSLRQILTADPKDRSRAIDKILGTFEIRDFAEALDIKRKLAISFKKLEQQRSSLERDKVQVAATTRDRLSKQREELETKGWKDRLSEKAVGGELKKITRELFAVAKGLGQELTEEAGAEAPMKIEEAQGTIENLRDDCLKLDRSRISTAASFRERRTSIAAALEQYKDSEKAIMQLGAEKSEDTDRKQGLEAELKSLTKELTALENTRQSLQEPAKTARTLDLRLGQLKETLSNIKSTVGDKDAQQSAAENLKNSLEKLQAEINAFSKQKQLVAVALDYLESSKPHVCPVCSQEIELEKVIKDLRQQSLDELSKQTEAAMAKLTKAKDDLRKLEAETASYDRLSSEQTKLDAQMQQLIVQVESITGQKVGTAEQLTKTLEAVDEKIDFLGRHQTELEAKLEAINERTKIIEQSRVMQGTASTKLQELVSKTARGEALLALAEKELEKIRAAETELADSKEIDQISQRLDELEEVTENLQGMEELKKLEQEIPRIETVAKDLETRLAKVTHLEASLTAISEILRTHLEHSVTDLLGSLEDTINEYYTSISGHPYFVKIHLEPDPKKPLIYNVRAVSKDETISTYVPTRFSSAQMNVVGISLFLAHAQKMLTRFSSILMDDPTQSFDESHKDELVELIKDLSKARQVFVATQDEQFSKAVEDSCGAKVSTWTFSEWSEEGPVVEAAE